MRRIFSLFAAAAGCVAALAACAREKTAATPEDALPAIEEPAYEPSAQDVALSRPPRPVLAQTSVLDPRRGRILFVAKGCVICHQANGVGGAAAPNLSADEAQAEINPLDFSARMWRGAPAMTALQTIELGYVIELDAQDIADLAAFAASPEEQDLLTLDSVSEEMRNWFLDEPYWRSGDWSEFVKRGDRIPGMIEETP